MGGPQVESRLKLLSRGMQAAMIGVALSGIATQHHTWVMSALLSLLVSEIPSILRRDLNIVLPVELNFAIVLALFLHVVGGFSGLYDNVPGWDHITHALSASLIAALAFVLVVAVDKYADSIRLPRMFLAVFILIFTMFVGVVWEIMEFVNDELTGSRLQYSLSDSMMDLLFDGFAGLVVAVAGAQYLLHTTPEHFIERMGFDGAKERVEKIIEKRRKNK